MDTVRFYKGEEVENILRETQYEIVYSPPYSPFLNPIENMFSKWKNHTRRGNIQNEEQLMELIITGSNLKTKTDCEGYYKDMILNIPRCINNIVNEDLKKAAIFFIFRLQILCIFLYNVFCQKTTLRCPKTTWQWHKNLYDVKKAFTMS